MHSRLLRLVGASRKPLARLQASGMLCSRQASSMSSTMRLERYQTCLRSSLVRLESICRSSRLTANRQLCASSFVKHTHCFIQQGRCQPKTPAMSLFTHYRWYSLPFRACDLGWNYHALPPHHSACLCAEGHHPCWSRRTRHRTTLYSPHRLLSLAVFPTLARVDRLLLQHHPRPLR